MNKNQVQQKFRILKLDEESAENYRYILVTSMTAEEIVREYGKELAQYSPFLVRSPQEQFNLDCKCLNLQIEYPQWNQKEKWGIYTSYTQAELEQLYPKIISWYEPYISLTEGQYQVMMQYNRNENKFRVRGQFRECFFNMDLVIDKKELISNSILDHLENKEKIGIFKQYLDTLDECRQRRLKKYLFSDKSFFTIAAEEGVSRQNIQRSIKRMLGRFRKYYSEHFTD